MVDIKDISGNTILSTSINEGAKRKFTLQKEDYIILKFSVDEPIYFKLGDFIDNEIGLFELVDVENSKPTYNESTGGYDYELRFDAYYYKWKNKKFKYTPEHGGQEASWNLTASLDVHLGIFLRNLTALEYTFRGTAFQFTIDGTVENSAKLVSYDNTNMIDALTAMAEAWGCEWWVTDNIIHFGRCEFGDPVDFEIGVNVKSMSRSASQTDYATRIIAFGSDRNIPTNYRPVDEQIVVNGVVQRRLMLPVGTPYVDAYEGMSQEEAVEDIVVFDDIYPRRVGTMSDITTKEYTDTIENEDGTKSTEKWNAYRFKDTDITFSKDYIIAGQQLKIKFESGSLNGMEFGVSFNPDGKSEKLSDGTWNPEAQLWEIIRNDDYGRNLPGDILIPKNGDTYVLSGFDTSLVSDQYLPAAEQELKERTEAYVTKTRIDPSTYDCKMNSVYMFNDDNPRVFEIGDKVNLINKGYFKDGRVSRIIGFEYNLDKPYDNPVYTVGETAAYSRIGDIEDKVDAVTYKGQTYTGTGGSGVYIIRLNDSTTASNSNVFSALRQLDMFLRKNAQDKAAEIIDFLKGLISYGNIEVGEAIDSFLAGKGIVMTPDGRIQCNTIEARESAKFFELIYNRLSALEGDFVFTESGTVESATLLDGTYKLIMRKRWDNDTTALDVDDVLRSKVNNLSAVGDYASGWYRVIDKDSQENSITVVMYALSECPGGVNSAPATGMMIHRWGNTNATKTDRQRCWYMSSSEGRLVWLTGVNKPIVDQDNYATFYGLPINLPMFEGKPINYNQPYLYLRGLIVQDIIRVDYQGNTIYELTDRGTWSAVTAASNEPYFFEGYNEVKKRNEISTVYHRGSKWQCLHTNTQLEPKWNSPDWEFLEGNGEFNIDFSSTNGFSFFYGRVNTDVQVEIYHGSVNITEDIKDLAGVVVEWKRNSGNEAEDNSWVPIYLDSSKLLLHFTETDMGSSWLQNQSVTFTVTVYIPLGYGQYTINTESFNFQ